MKKATKIAQASIALIATILLVQPVAADGWWDGTATVDLIPSGFVNVGILGEPLPSGKVIGGTATETWFGSSGCGGTNSNTSHNHFTIETSLGTVKGGGWNGLAVWTWNGIEFEGTVSIGYSASPGGWVSSGSVSLSGHSVGLPNLVTFDLFGTGVAAGTYAHGPCEQAEASFQFEEGPDTLAFLR